MTCRRSRVLATALAVGLLVFAPLEIASMRNKGSDDDDGDAADADDGENPAEEDDNNIDAASVSDQASAPVQSAATVQPQPAAPPTVLVKKSVKTKSAQPIALSAAKNDDDSDADDSDGDSDDDASTSKEDPKVQRLKTKEQKQKAEMAKVEQDLDMNLVHQTSVKAKLSDVNDPAAQSASDQEINLAVVAIENETQSQALGTTLGKMWKEMRMYASPFYNEHLDKKLKTLRADEGVLEKKEKSLRTSLDGTRKELDKALETGSDGDEADETEEKDETKSDSEEEAVEKEEVKSEKKKPAKKNDETYGNKHTEENRRMWLGVWLVSIVAMVVAVFFMARGR